MDTFAASMSNEITKGYYFFVRGLMNEGTTKLKVAASKYRGYTTYHLISVR